MTARKEFTTVVALVEISRRKLRRFPGGWDTDESLHLSAAVNANIALMDIALGSIDLATGWPAAPR